MKCVTECDTSTQIAINDTQLGNMPICRDFEYYVDPGSDSIIELGTVEHPYKHILYALVEVLNYHSHSDRNLTIYLMEYTKNELTESASNIINITSVEIRPYTSRSSDPDKAYLIGKDTADIVSNPSTSFSILKSYELRFDDMVTNNNDLTDTEKQRMQLDRYLILAIRSGITIFNMEIISEHGSVFDDILLVFPVYLQTRTVKFRDVHLRISGTIVRGYDPFNIDFENIDVDYYRNSAGVDMTMECNYPEANIEAHAYITNITWYNTQNKVVNPPTGSMLKSELPGNFIIKDYYWSNHVPLNDQFGATGLIYQATCAPEDAANRYYNVTNGTIPVQQPGIGVASNFFVANIVNDIYRSTDSYLFDIDVSNVYASSIPSIFYIGNIQSAMIMRNWVTINNTSVYALQLISAYGTIEFHDMYFELTDALTNLIIEIQFIGDIIMNNITINNNDILNTDPTGFFHFLPLDGRTIQVSNLTIMNSNIGDKPIIEVEPIGTANMRIDDVFVQNVTLNTDNNIVRTQSLKSFSIKNSTLIQLKPQVEDDTTPKAVELSSLILKDQQSFTIIDTYLEQSSIGFIELSGIKNNETLSSSFIITNFTYVDSYLKFSQDLISFVGIETSNEFQIELSEIYMRNITFVRTGRLLVLEHQTNTTLKVSNWYFKNLNGGKIDIKSTNLNIDLNTKVKMTNITATSLSCSFNSFISVDEGGRLYMYNSSFINVDNTERGAVLNAGYQKSYIEVHNSTFRNNLSIYGAVANVQDSSVIKFYDSNLTENFAIQSGAIQVSSDGYFELYRWNVANNYAYTISVSELFISIEASIFSNSSIHNNTVISNEKILEEFNTCENLCFISNTFKQYIQDNPSLLSTVSLPYSIHCISGVLTVTNNTFIANQSIFINSYLSTINIENSRIYDITTDSSVLIIIQSNITITNSTTYNLQTSTAGKFIQFSFGSKAVFNQISYVNSTMEFIEGLLSNLSVTSFTANQIQLSQYLIEWVEWLNLKFDNFTVNTITTAKERMINIAKTQVDLIQGIVVDGVEATVMNILNSNVTDINNCNMTSGIHFTQSSIDTLRNSKISNSGSTSILYGGALKIENSNSTMTNMTFDNNVAQIGGAIHISCDTYDICQNIISDSTFSNNIAVKQGGAINYDFRRPELSNLTFNNNEAAYGPNIASYPVRIVNSVMVNDPIILTNVTSGMAYHETIRMLLVDYDSQTMNLVNSSQINISPVTSGARLESVDYSVLINGQADFDNLKFVYGPGQDNIEYVATCDLIDSNKVSYLSFPTNNSIDVSFRYCQPGEQVINNEICSEWSAGTYSFTWNSTQCKSWMDNAVWLGGSQVYLLDEYWRLDGNSTDILFWPRPQSCKGGYLPEFEHPVEWEKGYKGYLWARWDIVNGQKYQKISTYQWARCPHPALNGFLVGLVMILTFAYLTCLIITTIRKKKENQTSILLRIMTNYLQLITAAYSFNLRFPESFLEIFGLVEILGSSSDAFLSFDWFVENTEIKFFTPSTEIFKVFLTIFLPIVLILIFSFDLDLTISN